MNMDGLGMTSGVLTRTVSLDRSFISVYDYQITAVIYQHRRHARTPDMVRACALTCRRADQR